MSKIIFVILLSCCGSLFAQTQGQVVQGSIELLDDSGKNKIYALPLPSGEWKIIQVNSRVSTGSGQARMKDVRVIQSRDGRLVEAIEITYHAGSQQMQWNDEPCKMEPTLYKNNYGTAIWKQKCLTISSGTFLQNNNAATRLVLEIIAKEKISHDLNSIAATYSRYGDFGKFLIVKRHFFPSVHGLENPVVSIMNTSPYHPAFVANDMKKKSYVEALVKYMEDAVISFDAAYEGNDVRAIPEFQP